MSTWLPKFIALEEDIGTASGKLKTWNYEKEIFKYMHKMLSNVLNESAKECGTFLSHRFFAVFCARGILFLFIEQGSS